MNESWPVAELDAVRRLRVVARTTPGTSYAEHLLDAPFDRVWALASDLEHQLPLLITDIKSFTVTSAAGERLEARARSPFGLRARFDVVLRPGWCLMQSRFVLGGMAAVPEGEGTRFAFLGGLRVPGIRLADRALHSLLEPLGGRALRRFTDQLGP
ncbi:hypothetical protein GCM10010193_08740 [Kitasatospora atroaurantiaca]|uniref:Carbon monoxide dehydrogenase subunit G n=1 Tax=Kitasatospora atroaurantiaca TaxID=285545 RepID=A0A561ERU0_9ACTN|nr:hypothetical protein [Kitasatospora atroaurantiaca]TWE18330.1 carbon monoxide dehydrogenase subunit G [Kitasatospora atroaurantiaca]